MTDLLADPLRKRHLFSESIRSPLLARQGRILQAEIVGHVPGVVDHQSNCHDLHLKMRDPKDFQDCE